MNSTRLGLAMDYRVVHGLAYVHPKLKPLTCEVVSSLVPRPPPAFFELILPSDKYLGIGKAG